LDLWHAIIQSSKLTINNFQDRGPILEVIVSRMRYIADHTANTIRIVGLSTALANARDLGDWLGIQGPGTSS
jgi:replicative superfamily II helicase